MTQEHLQSIEDEPTGGIAEVMALAARSEEFAADTIEAHEALSQRVNFLSSRILEIEEKHREGGTMTQEQLPKKRVRINVTTSVKGVKTWDCTVELVDSLSSEVLPTQVGNDVLLESDWLVSELDKRYPAPAP